MSLIEFEPRTELPRHTHDAAEILYILSGSGEMQIGSEKLPFGPEQAIHLPENQPHGAKFKGGEKTVALQIFAPAGPEQQWKGLPVPPRASKATEAEEPEAAAGTAAPSPPPRGRPAPPSTPRR